MIKAKKKFQLFLSSEFRIKIGEFSKIFEIVYSHFRNSSFLSSFCMSIEGRLIDQLFFEINIDGTRLLEKVYD